MNIAHQFGCVSKPRLNPASHPMASISVLHAPNDQAFSERIAEALASEGMKLLRIDGDDAGELLLDESAPTIVVWSYAAARLGRLHKQAQQALERGALIPVAIGGAAAPLGFERLQPVDLTGWSGDAQDPRWRFVLDEIRLSAMRVEAAPAVEEMRDLARKARNDDYASAPVQQPAVAPPVAGAAAAKEPKRERGRPRGRRFSAQEIAIGASSAMIAASVLFALSAPIVLGGATTPSAAPQPTFAPRQNAAASALQILEEPALQQQTEAPLQTGARAEIELPAEPVKTAVLAAEAPAPHAAAERGDTFSDCTACPQMTVLPPGAFDMGAPRREIGRRPEEGPVRRVEIPAAFAMASHEITFDEWAACVADGGCNAYAPYDHGWGKGSRPVINVSYEDAGAYAAWLSQQTGEFYRLPTEEEWEYAARAGSQAPFSFGETLSTARANFNGEYPYKSVKETFRGRTTPTASFKPNAFGLYDMHGNVWEWTSGCWQGDCARRVLKGGAWNTGGWRLRSAHRIGKRAAAREYDNGFRVVREIRAD